MNLIISTLEKDDLYNKKIIENIQKNINKCEAIYAEDMNIKGCIGCNRCWLVTPGVCTIKDDYEKLLIKFLQSEQVIFVTDLKLGFVSYKLKNIIDILQGKMIKRNLSIKILDPKAPENALGGNIRQVFELKKGLTQELAKKIVAIVKDSKLKVQASIQGEQVRVSGKSRDDLQDVIKLLKEKEEVLNIPLQFTNYR